MKLPVKYSTLDWRKGERQKVRNEYIKVQDGKCMFCKKPLTEPPTSEITDKKINWDLFPHDFLKYPIHLQHNHYTRMTEGAVHAYCNAVLWQYHGR